jgi:hypothetical protein
MPLHPEEVLLTKDKLPTVALGHLILPPSRQSWSRGEMFRPSGYIATSVYWAHNTSMRSVGSILAHRGPTHRSLTDTGGGDNLEGADFPHSTTRPSQPTVLPFPPKGLARSPDYSKSNTGSKVQV